MGFVSMDRGGKLDVRYVVWHCGTVALLCITFA